MTVRTAPVHEGRGGFGIVRHMSLRASAVGCLSGSLPVAASAALVACNGGLVFCPPVCPGNNLGALLGLPAREYVARTLPARASFPSATAPRRENASKWAASMQRVDYKGPVTEHGPSETSIKALQAPHSESDGHPLVSLQHLDWEIAFFDSQSAEGHSWHVTHVLYPCSISYSLRAGACAMGTVQPLSPHRQGPPCRCTSDMDIATGSLQASYISSVALFSCTDGSSERFALATCMLLLSYTPAVRHMLCTHHRRVTAGLYQHTPAVTLVGTQRLP